jgi:hypothetical protein
MKKQFTIKFKLLELEPDNYHIVIKGKIEKTPVHLVIDTGASHSCFDLNFVRSLNQDAHISDNDGMNVGVGSSDFESKITILQNFKIGNLKIKEYKVVLIDLENINMAYRSIKLSEVQGIIGGDFLKKHSAVINYHEKELTLWKNN